MQRQIAHRTTRALVIALLGHPTAIVAAAQPVTTGSDPASATAPPAHTVELDPEVVWSSDVFLTDARLNYRQERRATEWEAGFSYATFDLDYQPSPTVDFFGFEEHLHEDRFGGQASVRQTLTETVTALGTLGFYDGFPDYRRVWIANRYDQKYNHPDFPTTPGYESPDPMGFNISAGVRWKYLPASAIAEMRFGYAYDRTAPGYADGVDAEGEFVLLRGREKLSTFSGALSSENVLSSRVRMLNEFAFTGVTERSLRFGYQGSVNLALGERWVARTYGGVTTEAPQFNAFFIGTSFEHELKPDLLLSVTGRYYRDTGEIENALVTPSAAPALRSWETGLALRYHWANASLKLYAGLVWADYAPAGSASEEFAYLYVDRTWGVAQIAFSLQF